MNDEILMGTTVAMLSGFGLLKVRWLIANTRKGHWLTSRLGERRAVFVTAGVLFLLAVFGVLLAVGVIRPLNR